MTRTKKLKEVRKDSKSGFLWSDRLPSPTSQYNARKACNSSFDETANIDEVTWSLPSMEEYGQAHRNGGFVYYGGGQYGLGYSEDSFWARCVGK